MARLRFLTIRACSPERFVRLGAGLLALMVEDPHALPVLLVAELEGPSILLGRHQRFRSALDVEKVRGAGMPVHRRLGGGRAVLAPDRTLGIYLAMPRPGSLLPAPVGPDKLINRYIRGLNAGLTLAGAGTGAHYFGRDFISSESRQLGRVSQDGLPPGVAIGQGAAGPGQDSSPDSSQQETAVTGYGAVIFEALVAMEGVLALPGVLNGYPEPEDPRVDGPAPVALSELAAGGIDFETVAARIATGYERATSCEILPFEGVPPEGALVAPPVEEDEDGFEESGVADVAIGFAEALVRHDGEKILAVRFRGDFIAPAFVLRDLEEALVGCPLDFASIGPRVDQAFQRPGGMVLGLRSLRVLADAVLAAAGRLG